MVFLVDKYIPEGMEPLWDTFVTGGRIVLYIVALLYATIGGLGGLVLVATSATDGHLVVAASILLWWAVSVSLSLGYVIKYADNSFDA